VRPLAALIEIDSTGPTWLGLMIFGLALVMTALEIKALVESARLRRWWWFIAIWLTGPIGTLLWLTRSPAVRRARVQ
jgi:hypothetical protein